jgi:hypothetical protein
MRTRHWLTSLLSGALWTATAAVGLAQAGPEGDWGYAGGYTPYIDPGSPAAAQYAPQYSGLEHAGYPPGATQWPYISPYTAPAVDQHSYQNGFWYNEQMRGGRRYYAFLGGALSTFADPDDVLIGNPKAPRDFRTLTATGGGGVGTGATTGTREVFAARDWSAVEDHMQGGGFQGMMGFFNPDDSGWFLSGFWAEEGHAGYSAIDPPGDPARPVDTLRARAGIPIFDGSQDVTTLPPVPPNTTGTTVIGAGVIPYDMYYRLGWSSQAYGIGTGFYTNPVFRGGALKIRPMLGLRYLNVRENATFEGADSGLDYTIDGDNLAPVAGSVTGVPDVFESALRANTKAHLAGPEAGLRFDVGGDKFLVWTQSKFSLFANHSTREIDGFGIGRITGAALPAPTTPTPNDRTLTGFHEQDTTTHVSPAFEQSIFLRAPILSHVPGIRKLKVFEEAQFQMGYTFLVVGAMYRPGNVIDWAGFPQFPQLNSEKTTYFVSTWSWGVEWMY